MCRFFFAFSLAPLLYPRLHRTVIVHSTQQHLRRLLLLLYLWPPTRAAAAVCTYALQHSPPWLLLFIVNRLLIVNHAVLLLCHSYDPAHPFLWAQCSTCLEFSSCTCEDMFHFCFRFVFFFQLRLGSQSTYSYCRSSTFVCTGQRVVRARVVLWSTPGLASMKHFAFFSSDAYSRGLFFHLGYSFFSGMFFFNQSQPWILWSKPTLFLPLRRRIKKKKKKKEKKKRQQHVWYVRAHTYSYILDVY